MAKYVLTNKAVEDISKIWDYTYEVWSENQADSYYELLMEACEHIAKKPTIRKKYKEISEEIFGFGAGKHIIFHRILMNKDVEIVRVLHGRMDLKDRIEE